MINLTKIALISDGRSEKTYYLQALNVQQGFLNDIENTDIKGLKALKEGVGWMQLFY